MFQIQKAFKYRNYMKLEILGSRRAYVFNNIEGNLENIGIKNK